jgi:hypothetical protein
LLEDLAVRVFASAGRRVAKGAKLTDDIDGKLLHDPHSIISLIKDDLLNATAVDEEAQRLLQEICRNADDDIRRVAAALVWYETAEIAGRWLTAGETTPEERSRLRVTREVSTEDDVRGVLLLVAAVQDFLRRPFVFMMDELEHFLRYDTVRGSKRNVTWLKRLLEGLASFSPLVFVSGHNSAWEAKGDFLERFSHRIRILKLVGSDALEIIRARVSGKIVSGAQAEVIVQAGRGNIRTILSLCRVLYERTDGFTRKIRNEEILAIGNSIENRLPLEEINQRIREILTEYRILVRAEAQISGIRFDSVGFQGDEPRLVIEYKHTVNQRALQEAARRFIEQMAEVRRSMPDLAGCFIAEGNIDREFLGKLRSDEGMRIWWFDLNDPDVLGQIKTRFDNEFSQRVSSPSDNDARLTALRDETEKLNRQLEAAEHKSDKTLVLELQQQRELAERQAASMQKEMIALNERLQREFAQKNSKLEDQLREIEKRRTSELAELLERLDKLSREASSPRTMFNVAPQPEEKEAPTHSIYQELTKPVRFLTKLRFAFAGMRSIDLMMFAYVVLGAVILLIGPEVLSSIRPMDSSVGRYRPLMFAAAVMLSLVGLYLFWRFILQVEQFFDLSARLLRQMYLNGANAAQLYEAQDEMMDALEKWGAREGKHYVKEHFG